MVEFQIEFKKGALSIRLIGESYTELISALDDAIELFKKADKKLEPFDLVKQPESEELRELKGIPPLLNPSSMREAISELMTSDWGKTPRTFGEIMDAMETNAVFYSKSSVSSELSRMTRSGLLRRMQSAQGYKYVSGIKKKNP